MIATSRKIARYAGRELWPLNPAAASCVQPPKSSFRMRYFKLTIAYDGTDFHGWQFQVNKPTVQGEIVSVLRRITQENIQLLGAGRTDAGVHALGQVGSFRTQSALSACEFQRALNALLPPTIRIVAAEEKGPDFNARWSAKGKVYRYRIYRGKVVPPMLWRYVLHYPFPLDEDAMTKAAARFVGVHDFSSFAASSGSEEDDKERNMEREIFSTRTSPYRRRPGTVVHRARAIFLALHGPQNGGDATGSRAREISAGRYRQAV